ncbi:UNVERIFIED_CONTAM: Amino acid permease 3 [Sesamum radiatum]|uniref:Amino acid permease 3 n=1 Tax=Sesamum radiatum TaxID=300843 RepID=A0AAW2RE61_SESRA
MGESTATTNNHHHHHHGSQVFDVSVNVPPHFCSKVVDDDGRPQRTGMYIHKLDCLDCQRAHNNGSDWLRSSLLGLGYSSAGWIAGPTVMFLFSFVIYYTSTLLADCYRSGDPLFGKRNYTYMDAVRSNLGGSKVKFCGIIQYLNLFGVAIGYTIAASISMMAIKRSNCFHASGEKDPCHMSSNPYMIAFGITQILFSQIPDFDQIWWLSIVAAVMSFTYSSIGLGLGIAKVAATGTFKGSLTGISIGTVTETQKIWRSFQALGDIAFAYSFSIILIEIQDTIKSPPSEAKTMKKASLISTVVTTAFYMLCGCMGYAAFGDLAPGNLLTGFGFYNPFWLLDIANAAIVIHLVGAYQVYCQPLFAFVEKHAAARWPESGFITKEISIHIPCLQQPYNLNMFRLVWRSVFVVLTTVISMLLPFFNDVVGILGAFGFWPLTVYFPVEMYIAQKRIAKWSTRWICLQMLSFACLAISIAAAAGSVAGVVLDLKVYRPFKTSY